MLVHMLASSLSLSITPVNSHLFLVLEYAFARLPILGYLLIVAITACLFGRARYIVLVVVCHFRRAIHHECD